MRTIEQLKAAGIIKETWAGVELSITVTGKDQLTPEEQTLAIEWIISLGEDEYEPAEAVTEGSTTDG